MVKSRLFIAIDLSDEIKNKLFAEESRLKEIVRGNFVPEQNFHINLQFLGFVDPSEIEKIKHALSQIKTEKFELAINNFGSFPRVLWCDVSESQELRALQQKIAKEMKKLGFLEYKEFHPHITLVRIKEILNKTKLSSFLKEKKDFGKFEVQEFILFRSFFVRYEPVSQVPLLDSA